MSTRLFSGKGGTPVRSLFEGGPNAMVLPDGTERRHEPLTVLALPGEMDPGGTRRE